ncbi:MAG TPA: hypothetical protein VNQ99_16175 [Xanthobacteraceae bacterium]|nr:hypothetical protein [Xanthobacteraceae bacterium]
MRIYEVQDCELGRTIEMTAIDFREAQQNAPGRYEFIRRLDEPATPALTDPLFPGQVRRTPSDDARTLKADPRSVAAAPKPIQTNRRRSMRR